MSRRPWPLRLAVALLAAGAPLLVRAHTEAGTADGGFLRGLLHPLTGSDHLLAMVAVGLWGAFLQAPLVWQLPLLFPAFMVVGAVAALAGLAVPQVEAGVALSVLVLGAAIAAAWRAPVAAALAPVALFGFLHGYAHGVELPEAASPAAFAAGFVLASGLLHGTGIAIGSVRTRPHGTTALRLVGGAIAAVGALLLAQRLAA